MNINKDLINKIIKHNDIYRKGDPEISDEEYDMLLDELKNGLSEEEYYKIRISLLDPLDENIKCKHPFIMGSLDKIKSDDVNHFQKWIKNQNISNLFVSAKVDGMSCRLQYNNLDNQFVLGSASSRGNGEEGQYLTAKIVHIKGVPYKLNEKYEIYNNINIRGEIVIKNEDFKNLNYKLIELGHKPYKNPRNAVVGIFGKKYEDDKTDELINLQLSYVSFIAYEIMGTDISKLDQFKILESSGFETPLHTEMYDTFTSSDVENEYILFNNSCQYTIDGLVLCSSDYISNENEYIPKGMVAFKVNNLIKTTKILDVKFEGPSKSGRFVPVAIIDPIELGGSTICKATCHNAKYIKSNNLKYGAEITIQKSGDVIPYIENIISNGGEENKNIEIPEVCPSCGTKLIFDDNGVELLCTNRYNCPEQLILKVNQFIRRLGVKNASIKTLKRFNINTYKDLLAWRPDASRSNQALYNEMLNNIFKSDSIKILSAIDFDDIGEKSFYKIVEHYGWENVINKNIDLGNLPTGIGLITIAKFIIDLDHNINIMNSFTKDSRWNPIKEESVKKNKDAISFCFTGSLSTMSRSEAIKKIQNKGWENKGSVSKGLTYLVTNDPNSGSSKNKKAKSLGIKIIDENNFIKIVNDEIQDGNLFEL